MDAPSTRKAWFGGRPSLGLTWTLARRLWAPTEYLTSDADVVTWLVAAGLADPATRPTKGTLADARDLREAIFRSVHRRIAAELIDRPDLAVLNRWAAEPPPRPRLIAEGSLTWTATDPVRAGLGAVALDAVELLGGPIDRLRECSRDGCAALYYDASPAGRRRWCSAERCGNLVNTARYRHRTRGDSATITP